MTRYKPTSIREVGLRNHLGDEVYSEFVKRMKLKEPVSIIARAIGKSRNQTAVYRDIYHEEQGLHKPQN